MGALCIDFASVLVVDQMHSVYQDHLAEIINNNAPFKTLSVKGKKRRLTKAWLEIFWKVSESLPKFRSPWLVEEENFGLQND